jgi:hypothetical protein
LKEKVTNESPKANELIMDLPGNKDAGDFNDPQGGFCRKPYIRHLLSTNQTL